MHAGKTKILTTDCASRHSPASCGGHNVEVLKEGGHEKYLGRKLSVDEYHSTELDNRISMGWAAFFKFKGVLCNKYIAIKDRMALFVSCVEPCILYACGTWTMTMSMEHKLRCAQRRMLRRMIRHARKDKEEWADYIRRATRVCGNIAREHGCIDWVTLQRRRKFELAAKSQLYDDGCWSNRLLNWRPWFRCAPFRRVGHPRKRWNDTF